MKKSDSLKRLLSFILSAILIMSVCCVGVFAADYSFTYCFTNDSMSQIYIDGLVGDVPDNGHIIIPDTINGFPVVGIAANAFTAVYGIDCVVIPYTTAYIDENAFVGSNNIVLLYPDEYEEYANSTDNDSWTENTSQDYIISGSTIIGYIGNDSSIIIPEDCTAIADGVFKNNKNIKMVYIHKNIKSIGENAFKNCKNLETVTLDKGMGAIEIGANAFDGTPWLENYNNNFVILGTTLVKYKGNEKTVAVPNVLTAVADGAFYGTQVTTVKVPVTITLFGGIECFNVDDTTLISVYKDSPAEEYCQNNNIMYAVTPLPGDVDASGDITAADARYILRVSANLEKAVDTVAADITGDNEVTAADARQVLRISAQLTDYSVTDLLTMPRSSYEVMLAVSNAVAYANAYNCGYTKFAYEQISQSDMNLRTARNLIMFEDELTSPDKAATTVYKHNTQAAKDNFFDISLINSDNIQSCTSILKDNSYAYTITLKDELATVGEDTFTQQMFPVESASHFDNALSKKSWYDKFNWSMTYTGCTIEIQVEMATGRITYAYLTMNYGFEMTGKTGNTAITNADGTSSIATATRTDVIRYTNFSYYE